jgi:hypothetical protein
MEKRPLSLTIIAWLLIVGGIFGLYTAATLASNATMVRMLEETHTSIEFQRIIVIINAVVSFAAAYGIFNGLPWSRVFLTGWSIVSLAIGFFTSPIRSVIFLSVILTGVFTYFLFRAAANRWFAAKGLQLRRCAG